jgi:hypothetical protein
MEAESGTNLVLPESGVVVDLEDEREVTLAYRDLRNLKDAVLQAERRLKEAFKEIAAVKGTKTFYIDGLGKVELRGGERVEYDAKEVEEGLRALGCPEDILREIVVETVTYKVDGNRARRAASANPEYARVIENARTTVETLPSVSIV